MALICVLFENLQALRDAFVARNAIAL